MGLVPARCPGWLLEGRGNPSPRGMAAQSRFLKRDGQNPAYRPSGILVLLRLGSCLRRRTFSLYRSMDAEAEEIERRISINLSVAHAVHRDVRINFLDAPGYGIFSPEARSAAAAADAAIIVLDAVSGVEVQTEKAWKFAAEFNRPVLFVVNRMDRERAYKMADWQGQPLDPRDYFEALDETSRHFLDYASIPVLMAR